MRAERKEQIQPDRNPPLILTIANGAAHNQAAEAIARAIDLQTGNASAVIVDVSKYMSWFARLTHVTIYLWLIKYLPGLWGLIDRYQKRRRHTSPEWYYRRGCRRLFQLAQNLRPSSLIATEVGCCEIAALIKRELKLNAPLVAVDIDHDADRAWVRAEVDLYCVSTEEVREQMLHHGARPEQVQVWGVPLNDAFYSLRDENAERMRICQKLKLDAGASIVLIAGGAEGLGKIEEIVRRLLKSDLIKLQIVVLSGNNQRLRRRCENLSLAAGGKRLRVLGWTDEMPALMRAADLLVSKTGVIFDEAIASELPIIALEPLPGSERVKYRLLDEWGVGRAVSSLDELRDTVVGLLLNPGELSGMRESCRRRQGPDAASYIARWLMEDARQVFVYASPAKRLPARKKSGSVDSLATTNQPL